ncbi:hypothetical protein DPMN_006967 [Dreissena polymorpha]|uniref:Uncharacterized protein n=1 Tax=Dreissena polymorpha TaxID=45954 RepID=A0A9D4RVV7_DREPO|nr:hypothetical protein DPMN_006967 [Dreissena polymorpha]
MSEHGLAPVKRTAFHPNTWEHLATRLPYGSFKINHYLLHSIYFKEGPDRLQYLM